MIDKLFVQALMEKYYPKEESEIKKMEKINQNTETNTACKLGACEMFLKCNNCSHFHPGEEQECDKLSPGASRRGKHNKCFKCKYINGEQKCTN